MPFKLIACAAAALSGLVIGLSKAGTLYRRRDCLRDLELFVQTLATCLRYQSEELFESVARAAENTCLYPLTPPETTVSFEAWWQEITERLCRENSLQNSDKELLLSFGSPLGATDLEGQLSHLALYRELLKKQLDGAERDITEKSRLYRTLGLFGGACAAIMLL